MKSKVFPQLQTKRLLLRNLDKSDWQVVSYLRTDSEVNQFVERSPAPTKEDAMAFIQKCQDQFQNETAYQWCITIKPDEKMVGSICLWNISEDGKKAEVGYDLDPKHQKKGIMDEALKAVIEYGFNSLGVEMIDAYTQKNNPNSIKLLEGNGFKRNKKRRDEENELNWVYEREMQE